MRSLILSLCLLLASSVKADNSTPQSVQVTCENSQTFAFVTNATWVVYIDGHSYPLQMGTTNDFGIAVFDVPNGTYIFDVWKDGYLETTVTITVTGQNNNPTVNPPIIYVVPRA